MRGQPSLRDRIVATGVIVLISSWLSLVQCSLNDAEFELLSEVRASIGALSELDPVVAFSERVNANASLQMHRMAMEALESSPFSKSNPFNLWFVEVSEYVSDLKKTTQMYDLLTSVLMSEERSEVRLLVKHAFDRKYLQLNYMQLEAEEITTFFEPIERRASKLLPNLEWHSSQIRADGLSSDLKSVQENRAKLTQKIASLETNRFFPPWAELDVKYLEEQWEIGKLPKVDREAVKGLKTLLHKLEGILAKKESLGRAQSCHFKREEKTIAGDGLSSVYNCTFLIDLIHDQILDYIIQHHRNLSLVFPITSFNLDQFETRTRAIVSRLAPDLLHKVFKSMCDQLNGQVQVFARAKAAAEAEYKKHFDWDALTKQKPREIVRDGGERGKKEL